MATRVLNTIKEKNVLVGFRIICSLSKYKGQHVFNLADAKNFYKSVEAFENVRYIGNNQWEGLECSLDKLPVQNKSGAFTKCDEGLYVLGKMTENGRVVGFKLMDLRGDVTYSNVADTLSLASVRGLINAKLVKRDNSSDYIISSIRRELKSFERVPQQAQDLSKGAGTMEKEKQHARYMKLGKMFGGEREGRVSFAEIFAEIGCSGSSDCEPKMREYLGEAVTEPIQKILDKLYQCYQISKATTPVGHTVAPHSAPHAAPKDNLSASTAPGSAPEVKNVPSTTRLAAPLYHDNDTPKMRRMRELVAELGRAAEAYYIQDSEVMSNYEYDEKYQELENLESELGVILSGSVTQRVGYEVKSKLLKVKHPSRMLSLDKTKDRENLANSLGGQDGFLGWKLDGLTICLTYSNGELVSAVTRGDGVTGEDVTHNAKFFKGVPLRISYKDDLVVRGEALISYADFEKTNKAILLEEDKYKNPRNLASGSVRQLNSKKAKERNINVVSFTVVSGFDNLTLYTDKLEALRQYGFDVVEYKKVTQTTMVDTISWFEKRVSTLPFPTDGLVATIDDISYGEALGTTAKFPRNSKAFKWKDEDYDTTLVDVFWSASRTGALNPVAVFKPVDIEGSTISRASVHNVSIFKSLKLGYGDVLSIYRANMIIPQISKNNTCSATIPIPTVCPICNQPTEIVINETKDINGNIISKTETLMCNSPNCTAKHIGGLTHFVSRDAMNIEGVSESTLESLVNAGCVHDYKDLYHISDYENVIVKLDGFGKVSYTKLYKAIEKSRDCELHSFLYSLGVAQLGRTTSKLLCRAFDYDLERILTVTLDKLSGIDGVGEKTGKEIVNYFSVNAPMVRELAKEMTFKQMVKIDRNSPIAGKIFCITGDVFRFKNRKELQAKIESLGAKASSSVSAKTNYLINNDVTSGSSKNQNAKKFGVPIISEADFIAMIGE